MKNTFYNDEGKYQKRTEFIWKLFWFSLCLFAIPVLAAIVSGFICQSIVINVYVSFAFGLIMYFFVALFLYKICDKYRNNPYFLNQENNLITRLNILFLISSFSLIIPLISDVITLFFTEFPIFSLFPLLSFIILYLPIFFYYYYKPIDIFDLSEGKFRMALSFKLSIKQINNLVIIFNYLISIIFLIIISYITFSYIILLIINPVFYFFSVLYTKKNRKDIKEAIRNKKSFLVDLIKFKQKFTILIVSLSCCLILMLPIITLIPLFDFYTLLYISFLIVIILTFYLKIRLYLFFHFNTIISNIINIDKSKYIKEDIDKKLIKYKKLNSYFSTIFIISYLIFAFFILALLQNLIFIIIQIALITPLFYLLSLYEVKLGYIRNNEHRYVSIINTIALLTSICFGLFSSLILSVQFIIFFISFLFILEFYARIGYFKKENVILIQNLMAVGSYLMIGYGFVYYPIIINNLFIPTGMFLSDLFSLILLNIIIIAGAFLLSLYLLYTRKFRGKNLKSFNYSVILTFLSLFIAIIALFNLRVSIVHNLNVIISILIISITITPLFFFVFLYLNYLSKVFSSQFFIVTCYYTCYIQVLTILSLNIIFIINNLTGLLFWILLDVIIFFILFNLQLKFGKLLGKIKDDNYVKYTAINSYIIFIGLILLSFLFFSTILLIKILTPLDNNVLSTYISLIISCILVNLLSYKQRMFSELLTKVITFLTLFIAPIIVGYYTFMATFNTLYILIIPTSLFCLILYLPIVYLLKIKYKESFMRKILLINSLFLSSFILLIPSIIAIEVFNYGIMNIMNLTLLLLLGILSYLQFISRKININKKIINLINRVQVLVLLPFGITAIFFYSYLFLGATVIKTILPLFLTSIFYYLPSFLSYKRGIFNQKVLKYIIIGNSWVILGLFLLIPTMISMELVFLGLLLDHFLVMNTINSTLVILLGILSLIQYIYKKTSSESRLPNKIQVLVLFTFSITCVFYYSYLILYILSLTSYFLISLILTSFYILMISGLVLSKDVPKLKNWIQLISWVFIKINIFLLLGLFPLNLSLFHTISFSIVGITLLTPITRYYLRKLELLPKDKERIIKILELIIFEFFLTIFYIGLFGYFISNINYFLIYPLVLTILISCNLFLIFNFFMLNFKYIIETDSILQLYGFFLSNIILTIGLLYIIPEISPFLLFIVYIHFILNRSRTIINRVLIYMSLSLITCIDILTLLEIYLQISTIPYIPIGFYFIIFLTSLIGIISFSVITNLKRRNDLDLILLYTTCSIWASVFIEIYTNILIIYNITIFLFIFLLFSGITLYRRKDKRYKWLIRPCILLLIFDVFSYLSYRIFFINPMYSLFNPLLTFTLTLSMTDIAFIYLYRDLKDKIRQKAFYPVLLSLIISMPTFIGLILSTYSPIPLGWQVSLVIALNLGIFLFYLSVGVYKWKFSKVIWETGWWMWIFLPIINVFFIYQGFAGIDVITNAINVFGINTNLTGSIILTMTIITLLYIPILYTKIKKYFYHCLLFVWFESLFLVFWICQNLFILNPFLDEIQRNVLTLLSFVLIAVILVMPVLYKLTRWLIVSIMWWVLAIINISFFIVVLFYNGTHPLIIISVGVIIGSIFFMIYSYFPNIKNKLLYMVLSYITLLMGIFSLIMFIFYFIFYNLPISINISCIIIAFSLFSSKYLKFEKTDPKKYIHLAISLLLIFNFSSLTYNTFSIIPELLFFAIFLAIAVFGGSLFVFNHYNMLIRKINKTIPWVIMAFGTAWAVYSLCYQMISSLIFINWAIFCAINITFAYFWSEKYRYLLWYFFPLPIVFIIQEALLLIEIFQQVSVLIFIIVYIGIFQILVNIFNSLYGESRQQGLKKFFKNKNIINFHNFGSFLLNSVLIPLLISFMTPVTIEYKILEFLTCFSILHILSIKYAEISKDKLVIGNFYLFDYFDRLNPFFYFSLYIEVSIIFFIPSFQFIGIFEGIIISLTVLIFLTFLDILLVRKVNRKQMYSINAIAYLTDSIIISLYLNYILVKISQDFSWLILGFFLSMQFYTIYAFSSLIKLYGGLKSEKSLSIRALINNILFNLIFIIGCGYISSIFTNLTVNLFNLLIGVPSFFLLPTIFSFLMFLLNLIIYFTYRVLNRMEKIKQKNIILLLFYTIFQIFFAIFLIIALSLYNLLTLFALFLIILIETILSFYPFYLYNAIRSDQKSLVLKQKVFSILYLIIYFEVSLLFFGLSYLFLGFFESLMISQVVLFLIISIELIILKKFNRKYMYLIQTLCYIIISILAFMLLVLLIPIYQIFLSLAFLIFNIMQFYSNYSVFCTRNSFIDGNESDEEKASKIMNQRIRAQNIIGDLFYITLLSFIVHALILGNVNWTFILLCMSIIIHGLMKLDYYLFKFLGKVSNFFEIGSWILLMIFSMIYLSFFYFTFLIDVFITIVPLLWFTFTLEIAYLVKLLRFVKYVQDNKKKIRSSILLSLYIDFTTWPLFFSTLNPFIILNLFLLSFIILYNLLIIDKYLEVLKIKIRNIIRSSSFLIIGIIVSIDIFVLLQLFVQPINPTFNIGTILSISTLVFLIFLGIVLNPFKVRHLTAFIYWLGITSSSSLALLFGFSNIFLSIGIVIFFLLMFPFIFMLEELINLFRNFIIIIIQKWQIFVLALITFISNIKQALINAYHKIVLFLKKYFKIIYAIFAIIAFAVLFLFLFTFLNWLWYHSLPLSAALLAFLLYFISPAREDQDPKKQFWWRFGFYSIMWFSLTITLLYYILGVPQIISDTFNLLLSFFVLLVSAVIFGALILIYIYRLEKLGKLSVRYRFWTTLFFIIILIIAIILGVYLGIEIFNSITI
ncbi:MAG: hypothetical protein ACFFBP_00045 [Promethearchaeota archaeon]